MFMLLCFYAVNPNCWKEGRKILPFNWFKWEMITRLVKSIKGKEVKGMY